MVHLGELEHWLFVYFMMHFGLSQLHCYPTPVRSPFSGLITDSTCAESGPGLALFVFNETHVFGSRLPILRVRERGRKFPSIGIISSAE